MSSNTLCQSSSEKPCWIAAAAAIAGLGVALGAFGAHGLRATLEAHGRVATWDTAVLYHLVHGLALLAGGVWLETARATGRSGGIRRAAWTWTIGIVLFSGSLYALCLGGPKWLVWITPLGGVCLLAGWLVLGITAWRGHDGPHVPG